jgi:hypothetical protein
LTIFPIPALMKGNMTRVTMEAMMENLALPDSERVAIRNGYQNLVGFGWPTELISLGMCVEADRRQFDLWADGPTLFGSKNLETPEQGHESARPQWIFNKTVDKLYSGSFLESSDEPTSSLETSKSRRSR